jgi:hypothetical protein
MARFDQRMVRAALLDADAYEEVEADRTANGQALGVVLLSALATGIGSLENSGPSGILWHTVASIVLWYVWAYVTYFIGTRFLPSEETVADHGELLRTLGFSSAPGVLRLAMLVPILALPVLLLTTGWMLFTMVVAVRQALDYSSTGRAIAVCAIGFPVYAVGLIFSFLLLGPWPVFE